MAIIEITDRAAWNEPVAKAAPLAFLQSWDFGDFLGSIGRTIKRWGDTNNPEAQVQGIVTRRRFGSFVYLPHAPITIEELRELCVYFQAEEFTFVRIEPVASLPLENLRHRLINNRQAQHHWTLDVSGDIDAILGAMHPKTRYNIRLAEKKGVTIRQEKNPRLFLDLEMRTAERKGGFDSPQNLSYYSKFLESPNSLQTTAYYNDIPVASSILLCQNNVLTYLFGGSDNAYRAIMAPTLLQWYNITLAKQLGAHTYNFLGVAPAAKNEQSTKETFHKYTWDTTHPYSVLTRFKAGFGGQVQSFGQAADIILAPRAYAVMQAIEKYRRHVS